MAAGSTRAATATTPRPAAALVRAAPAATAREERRTARASPAASCANGVERPVRRAPLLELAHPVRDLLDPGPEHARCETTSGSAAAVPRRASTNASAPEPATSSTTAPADRGDEGGEHGGPDADQRRGDERLAHPQPVVEQGVDVVDDAREQVAAARAEAAGDQRDEVGEDPGPALGELAEDDVVAEHALGVTEHRTGEPEEPDPDDRHHQVEHRRLLAGAGDEPARGRREGDAGRGGQGAEQRGRPDAPPRPTLVVLVRDHRRGRRTPRAYDVRSGRSGVAGGHRGGRRHQLDHPVGGREHGRPVGHHDHQAALREEGEGLEEDLLGLLVEVGARLVEEHDRASGEHDAGQRDAGPAGRRTGRRRPHRAACPGRGGGRARRRPRPTLRRASQTSSSPRRGAADPHVGADGVGQQPRSLGCPPDQAAPPARVEVRERGAAQPDVAGHGRQLAAERGQQRRLAAARRPGDGDQAPVGQLEVERTGQGSAGGVADLEVAQHEPGRGGQRRAGLDQARRARGGRRRRRGRRCPRRPRGTPHPRGAAASRPRGRAAGR